MLGYVVVTVNPLNNQESKYYTQLGFICGEVQQMKSFKHHSFSISAMIFEDIGFYYLY